MPFTNILESHFRVNRKVCLLGPGPNGEAFYEDIPDDYQIIAISKAVLIEATNPSIWVMNRCDQDWYDEANSSFIGARIFHYLTALRAESEIDSSKDCYYFNLHMEDEDCLDREEMRPVVPGIIRGNGSVSGNAIQIAYHCGARDLLLCGIDMSGDGYFDGTASYDPGYHGETWWFTPRLNLLLKWMTKYGGAKISTLSPSKLDVPIADILFQKSY